MDRLDECEKYLSKQKSEKKASVSKRRRKIKKKQHKLCKLDLATLFKIFSKIEHSMDLKDAMRIQEQEDQKSTKNQKPRSINFKSR